MNNIKGEERTMRLEPNLRKSIINFLTPLTGMQSKESRRAVLYAAGLDAIIAQTNISGSPGQAVPLLVNALEQYGTVGDTPALVVFLREIARQVGQDKQRQIQDFCERLQQGHREPQQSHISEKQTPAGEQGQSITAQRDYFEQVGGNVYTGPVNIYHGTPAPASPDPTQKEPVTADDLILWQIERLEQRKEELQKPLKLYIDQRVGLEKDIALATQDRQRQVILKEQLQDVQNQIESLQNQINEIEVQLIKKKSFNK
jgi:hypothetical protein